MEAAVKTPAMSVVWGPVGERGKRLPSGRGRELLSFSENWPPSGQSPQCTRSCFSRKFCQTALPLTWRPHVGVAQGRGGCLALSLACTWVFGIPISSRGCG